MTTALLNTEVLPGLYREVGTGRVVDVIRTFKADLNPDCYGNPRNVGVKTVEFTDVESGKVHKLPFTEFAKVGRFARIQG